MLMSWKCEAMSGGYSVPATPPRACVREVVVRRKEGRDGRGRDKGGGREEGRGG